MPLKIISPAEVSNQKMDPVDDATRAQAQEILTDVKDLGEEGFLKHARRLGDLGPEQTTYILDRAALKAAFDALPTSQQELLHRTADRIRAFAAKQRATVTNMETAVPGGMAGQDVAACESAGCYAPGGRYPLPSSVLMTAITARVAGVGKVWVASPRPQPITLGAAHVADCDALLACGGAQAIAAMAYGMGDVPACDVIVGPGNRWVTAAKQLVSGRCAIDMLAGPSECLVWADSSADPATVAADLLAQAEHDTDAKPILVTTERRVAEAVSEQVDLQLATLSTAPVAKVAVSRGFAVLCKDKDEAVSVTNSLAPEHLEVQTADSKADAARLTNYGGLFIGKRTAEVIGDYGAGPNHVLPTQGTARYTGGLSVFTFLRMRTWLRIDDDSEAAQQLVRDSADLARLEGLEGHARAAECRLLGEGGKRVYAGEPAAKRAKTA